MKLASVKTAIKNAFNLDLTSDASQMSHRATIGQYEFTANTNSGSDNVLFMRVRRNDDHDRPEVDYMAGMMYYTIKSALNAMSDAITTNPNAPVETPEIIAEPTAEPAQNEEPVFDLEDPFAEEEAPAQPEPVIAEPVAEAPVAEPAPSTYPLPGQFTAEDLTRIANTPKWNKRRDTSGLVTLPEGVTLEDGTYHLTNDDATFLRRLLSEIDRKEMTSAERHHVRFLWVKGIIAYRMTTGNSFAWMFQPSAVPQIAAQLGM